jgi:S-(hydroxymethyl)glutathione dehydrogenase/alcohol dehydrogenase
VSLSTTDAPAAGATEFGKAPIKTMAAVMRATGEPWNVVELTLDPPKEHEVLVRYVASGLCHSDEHLRTHDLWAGTARLPMVGGHEGAGVIEAVGPGVRTLSAGDHVVCSFLPACGHCRWCSTGRQNLCDLGADLMQGSQVDGTFRFHDEHGNDYGGLCMLGTFSQYGVISEFSAVKVDKDLPLEVAVLVGCGVPTGWGSAVYNAAVKPGETVAIYGIGGVGINAVQGAAYAGAQYVVAIDPLENKRQKALELGATHGAASAEEAHALVQELTFGVGADKAIVTAGVVDAPTVSAAVEMISKGGIVTITGLAGVNDVTIQIPSSALTLNEKRIHGSLFGSSNPFHDILKMLKLYRTGHLKLDELVTRNYKLEDINQGYEDLLAGENIRGVILH